MSQEHKIVMIIILRLSQEQLRLAMRQMTIATTRLMRAAAVLVGRAGSAVSVMWQNAGMEFRYAAIISGGFALTQFILKWKYVTAKIIIAMES